MIKCPKCDNQSVSFQTGDCAYMPQKAQCNNCHYLGPLLEFSLPPFPSDQVQVAKVQCNVCGKWLPADPPVSCCDRLILDVPTGGERCDRCGFFYSEVWVTSDEMWQKVTGITNGGGLLCPSCFDVMAMAQGASLYWTCAEGVFPGRHHPFSQLDTP